MWSYVCVDVVQQVDAFESGPMITQEIKEKRRGQSMEIQLRLWDAEKINK
jgi:hypothetical protein